MNFIKNKKIIIYICAGAIFVYFTGRFLATNLFSRSSGLGRRIRLAEDALSKGLNVQKRKGKVLQDYKQCKPYLEMKNVDENQIIADLLREIENIVRVSGGSVFTLSRQETIEKTEKYKKYKATFSLEFKFGQLLNFLYEIQKSKLLLTLDKISLVSRNEQIDSLKVDGIVSLIIPL